VRSSYRAVKSPNIHAFHREVKAIMLEMREGNSQAQPLYEKHGYSVISRRDNYYAPGIHALIMRKEIHV